MNLNTKRKGNIMSDVYFNTSVSKIWNYISDDNSVAVTSNGFFVSHTDIKVALVIFDHDLSKKSILIGYSKASMDLTNVTYIDHM